MRPSIMSDGAITSQPASAWTTACRHSTSIGLVVDHIAVAQQSVVAVGGVGIERHVAHHADRVAMRCSSPRAPHGRRGSPG